MPTIPLYRYLKMLRLAAGCTRREVALWLGISPSAYAHYETRRYSGVSGTYLSILEKHYLLSPHVLDQLQTVNTEGLLLRRPSTCAENLAAFLLFYSNYENKEKYRTLTYAEKWCIYYCSLWSNKKALLSVLCAAPELSAFLFG